MIEIRTYDGDPEEFRRFSLGVWRQTYEGRMPLPLWESDYFEWQWIPESAADRHYLVAAYDGSRLVGSLLGEAFRFRLREREFDATMGGWMTVDPEYRKQGIGSRLFDEQRRRHLGRGAVFHLGYGYVGSSAAMGPRFWRRFDKNTVILGKVGFWARVFDHRAAAAWDLNRVDRVGTRLLGLVQNGRPRPTHDAGIRPYCSDDLDDCLALAHGLLEKVDLGYVWGRDRLARQLEYRGIPRTIVMERDGRVAGFVNYYAVDFLAEGTLRVGVIDLAGFGSLSASDGRDLLRAAMNRMVDEGIQLALILRLPCYRGSSFLRTGFVAMPRDFELVCVRMIPDFSLGGAKRVHVHWR